MDDEQQAETGVLFLDASSIGATDCNAGADRSPVMTGIIGGMRVWTVAMISGLSIRCS
jgi:hypothetical protein